MTKLLTFFGVLAVACSSSAQAVPITGGQTSVALDTNLLASVGLTLSGTTGPVISPGALPGSVAFPINSRTAPSPALPTTFTYTAGTVAPFSGTIEHSGGVLFNNDTLSVGDFTIGFDAGRIDTQRSGFFVADNLTFAGAALFDLASLLVLDATNSAFAASGDLLVSPELAGVLQNSSLAGVDVGDALVSATAVAEPGSLLLLALAGGLLVGTARVSRRQTIERDPNALCGG